MLAYARIFNHDAESMCGDKARSSGALTNLKRKGVQVLICRANREEKDVKDALMAFGRNAASRIFWSKAGFPCNNLFCEAGVVDEVVWFVAPMIIGQHKRLKSAWRLKEDGREKVSVRGYSLERADVYRNHSSHRQSSKIRRKSPADRDTF